MGFKTAHLWKRGKKYYIVYQNFDSIQVKRSVGNDFRAASRLLITVNEMLLDGRDPASILMGGEDLSSISLKDFFPMFIERHGRKQSVRRQGAYLERWKQIERSKMVNIPMTDMTKKMVYDYMYERSKKVSAWTVNMELSVIKVMFNKAVEWEIIESNPIRDVKKDPEPPKREVFLTQEQAKQLVEALPKTLGYIVEFAIYTGLRQDNILGLTIDQVDFTRGQVNLVIKGGRTESFLLSENALVIIEKSIGNRREGLVFPTPDGKKYCRTLATFVRTVDKLKLTVNGKRMHFHDLRHVYGSWLSEAGVSLDLIRLLMGHKQRSTTDRYVSIRNSALAGLPDMIPKIRE